MAVAMGAAWLLIELFPIVLVVVIGLMVAGSVSPLVAWLEQKKVRRGIAVGIVFGGMVAIAALVAMLTVPRLVSQFTGVVERLPKTQAWLADNLQRSRWSAPFAESVRRTRAPELLADAVRSAISHSPQIIEVVGGLVSAAFFALYLLIDRDRMRGGLFALVPRHYHVRLSRVLLGLETIVGGYVRGQVITSVLMSVFTFATLAAAGVPDAIVLSVFAGLTDVLPYVGGLLAAGPAVVAAFAKGPTTAIVVLCVLLAYQEFESRFIVPRVYGRVLRLPSAVVIIALLAGGQLLGILGALLALPIAAGLRLIVEELRFELPGEPLEDPASRARDEKGEREYEARAEGVPAEEAAAIATEIAQQSIEKDPPESRGDEEDLAHVAAGDSDRAGASTR